MPNQSREIPDLLSRLDELRANFVSDKSGVKDERYELVTREAYQEALEDAYPLLAAELRRLQQSLDAAAGEVRAAREVMRILSHVGVHQIDEALADSDDTIGHWEPTFFEKAVQAYDAARAANGGA